MEFEIINFKEKIYLYMIYKIIYLKLNWARRILGKKIYNRFF